MLRVEGPTAIEIQHLSAVILERVNPFFGWQAIAGLRLRQAPLRRERPRPAPLRPDPARPRLLPRAMPEIEDENLRQALARLGAAIKQT